MIMKLDTSIISAAGIVGSREHEGPLGERFDEYSDDDRFEQDTWEKAESEMQRRAFSIAMKRGGIREDGIDALFAGDLLNQCVGSAYGLSEFDIPYFGLYGACSTCCEGLLLAAAMTSAGYCRHAGAVTSSHYCAAERQYRTPLEYGAQRAQTAQRTVTGAGAFIVGRGGDVKIKEALGGVVIDKGVNDTSNMGAAMAPAALSTLLRYFSESGRKPSDFDLIVTGDLGYEGGEILCRLAATEGIDLSDVYYDCGMEIFDRERQDVHAGGSGCGCSAVVLACELLPKMLDGKINNILFIGTGAMMSPSSINQGFSIPAVAHLLHIGI